MTKKQADHVAKAITTSPPMTKYPALHATNFFTLSILLKIMI